LLSYIITWQPHEKPFLFCKPDHLRQASIGTGVMRTKKQAKTKGMESNKSELEAGTKTVKLLKLQD
jgi:hypothetical protein